MNKTWEMCPTLLTLSLWNLFQSFQNLILNSITNFPYISLGLGPKRPCRDVALWKCCCSNVATCWALRSFNPWSHFSIQWYKIHLLVISIILTSTIQVLGFPIYSMMTAQEILRLFQIEQAFYGVMTLMMVYRRHFGPNITGQCRTGQALVEYLPDMT